MESGRLNKNEKKNEQESVKILTFILLSYISPIIGVGFSLYILNDSDMRNYSSWVKTLAILALVIQGLFVLFGILGWFMWKTI